MQPETRIYRWQIYSLEYLGRSLRHRLMNIQATGIYGEYYGFRSLWDEFCYEQQEGPTSQLLDAWDNALLWPSEDVFDKIPQHVRELLSWSLSEEEEKYHSAGFDEHFVDKDLITRAIIQAAAQVAIDRDLSVLQNRAGRPWRQNSLKTQTSELDLPLFEMRSEPKWNLGISRFDLIEALKIVRTKVTLKRKGTEWEHGVTLAGGDGYLSIRSSNAAYDAPISGTWPSPILTPGAAFLKLAPMLAGATIKISYANGVLAIGSTHYPAREV